MAEPPSQLTPDDVRKVARLSRLAVPEADIERYREELGAVLGYIGSLRELDLSGVEPLTHVGDDLTEVWQQEGVVTRYRYDEEHYLSTIIDPEGYRTTYTYTDLLVGLKGVATRNVASSIGTYVYDWPFISLAFVMTYTDSMSRVWTHQSSQGYPQFMVDPLGNVTTYNYESISVST